MKSLIGDEKLCANVLQVKSDRFEHLMLHASLGLFTQQAFS